MSEDKRQDSEDERDDQETKETEGGEKRPGSTDSAAPADDDIIIK
ncbi:MAG TPA: hypothetical protein VGO56_17665 [Pyrinomonadaceae bacterium]|jgi:hypothetical protein|nr:hypothetical protein [Pyrinomonadaceae bacterium]